MREIIASARVADASFIQIEQTISEGNSTLASNENMDFFDLIQTAESLRYIVCRKADFAFAKRHNKELPHSRRGRTIA